MKRFVFTLIIMLSCISINAQVITYSYDTAGNRIKRLLSSPPPVERVIKLSTEGLSSAASLIWHMEDTLSDGIFEVQRSFEEGEWVSITSIEKAESPSSFSFIDDKPGIGWNNYRIKLTSSDRGIIYSLPQAVHFETSLSIYPNPVRERLHVKNTIKSGVEIIGKTGQFVYKSAYIPSDGIDVSQFAPGTYIIVLRTISGPSTSFKFVKEN